MSRVSIQDVASSLGVSTASVSYVLNGKDEDVGISKKLAEKIRERAKAMNYKPNGIAKALRRGRTDTIGLIVADISNPFYAYLAYHIQEHAKEWGYSVIITNTNEKSNEMEKMISVLKSRQVDGFIIVPSEHGEKQIEDLISDEIPLVLFDRCYKGIDVNYVGINNYQAAMEATNLLLNLDCKRIAHVTYKHEITCMMERREGYIAAMTNRGLYDPKLLKEVDFWTMSNDTQDAIMELVSSNEKIDGFFFSSTSIAINALKKLASLKLEIPKDIKVVGGFTKIDLFDLYQIPYVQQPISEMGKRAIELLIGNITKKDAPKVQEILQTKLVF